MRFRKLELEIEILPDANKDETLPLLRHAIVACRNELPCHFITNIPQRLCDAISDIAPIVREHARHVLHQGDSWLEVLDVIDEALIKLVARVGVFLPASSGRTQGAHLAATDAAPSL